MNLINWSSSQQQIFPIAYGVIIFISIFLGVLLRKKPEKVKNIPFIIITTILLVLEVVKQARAISAGSYSYWSVPLHFCSTFLIWFSLASYFKGKVRTVGYHVSFVTALGFLFGFIIGPTTIIGGATDNLAFTYANFSNLHTFYYHFAVVLFFALQISLKMPYPTLKNIKSTAIPFFSWMIVASIMANLLNTNFSNLLTNNVVFMDNIRLNFGYPIYLISMFLVFFAIYSAILAFTTLLQYIKRKIS